MKVKTLKQHMALGKERMVGDEYSHPNPKAEITLGFVENADKADGDEGSGKKAGGRKRGDSKK